MQQVRVQVYNQVCGRFEYLFDLPAAGWIPVVAQDFAIQVSQEYQGRFHELELVPPEHQPWFLVTGLNPVDRAADDAYFLALERMSPKAGSYVLMSLRRREIKPDEKEEEERQ